MADTRDCLVSIADFRVSITDFKSKIENHKLVVSEVEPSKIFLTG